MKFVPFIAMLATAACVAQSPTTSGPGFGTSVGGATVPASTPTAAVVAQPTTSSALPVFQARGRTAQSAAAAGRSINFYLSANRAGISGQHSGVAMNVLDISGIAFRIDGPSGSLGFLTNVSAPFLAGSQYDKDTLARAVGQQVSAQAGCAWEGQTVTQTKGGQYKLFAVYMSC